MLHKPVGLRAVHGLQRGALLRSAASNSWLPLRCSSVHLMRALSRSAALSRRCSSAVSTVPSDEGGQLCSQFCGQQRRHGAHALGLQRLVGVPQRRGVVLDRRGHIPGDDLRRVVVQRRHCHRLGAAGRAGVPPGDEAQQVRQQRGVAGVLAEDSARVECIRLHRVMYFMRASKALKGYSMANASFFFTIPAGRLVVKPFFLARRRAILEGDIKSTSAPVRGERGTLWKSL